MPSITGGDQTDRDYSPQMWVMGPPEDEIRPSQAYWVFVGNLGSVAVSRKFESYDDVERYHIGVTGIGKMVSDVTMAGTPRLQDPIHRDLPNFSTRNIPFGEVPIDLLELALQKSVDGNIADRSRLSLVRGLVAVVRPGFELPDIPEGINYRRLFNGEPEEQAAEIAKTTGIQATVSELREELGIQ